MFLMRAEANVRGHTCSLWGRGCLFNSERWVMTRWRRLWWRHRSWLHSLLTPANGPSPTQHSRLPRVAVWIIDGDCPVYWREKLPYSHHVATYMQSCLVFPKPTSGSPLRLNSLHVSGSRQSCTMTGFSWIFRTVALEVVRSQLRVCCKDPGWYKGLWLFWLLWSRFGFFLCW